MLVGAMRPGAMDDAADRARQCAVARGPVILRARADVCSCRPAQIPRVWVGL